MEELEKYHKVRRCGLGRLRLEKAGNTWHLVYHMKAEAAPTVRVYCTQQGIYPSSLRPTTTVSFPPKIALDSRSRFEFSYD
jgi:hypothetical protein